MHARRLNPMAQDTMVDGINPRYNNVVFALADELTCHQHPMGRRPLQHAQLPTGPAIGLAKVDEPATGKPAPSRLDVNDPQCRQNGGSLGAGRR